MAKPLWVCPGCRRTSDTRFACTTGNHTYALHAERFKKVKP